MQCPCIAMISALKCMFVMIYVTKTQGDRRSVGFMSNFLVIGCYSKLSLILDDLYQDSRKKFEINAFVDLGRPIYCPKI